MFRTMSSAADELASPSDSSKSVVPLSTWVLVSNFKLSYLILRRPDGSFNRFLAEFLDRKIPANPTAVGGVVSIDVVVDKATQLWGRIFWTLEASERQEDTEEPTERETAAQEGGESPRKPLLVYFHGGSFVHSSADSAIYDALCRMLARMCGAVVFSVNFRRAPEHRCPAPYDDGVACIRWISSAVGKKCLLSTGCDPENRCYVGGDSAGGNIAHNVAVRVAELGISLAGMVLLMPMFGGEGRTLSERLLDGKYFTTMKDRLWYWRAFLPPGADRDHPACNPFSASAPPLADISLPPCLVVVGGRDILQDWQLNYAHLLALAGKSVQLVYFEEAPIGFFLLPNNDFFYSFVERLREFLSAPSSSMPVSSDGEPAQSGH